MLREKGVSPLCIQDTTRIHDEHISLVEQNSLVVYNIQLCTTALLHFLHLVTSKGSYMGIRTLTLGSGLFGSMKILITGTLFQ